MQPDKLVTMANQIGTFFASQSGDAPAATASHITKFWDPRMRDAIIRHAEVNGDGLRGPARAAIALLKPVSEVARAFAHTK